VSAHTFCPSALFSLSCPPRTAHGRLLTRVLTQSRTTCPSANTRIRSNTVWPRKRQVKARYRTQANRKQWDYSYGNEDMLGASIDVVCHWSSRILDPRCPVLFLRFVDVATYRAPSVVAHPYPGFLAVTQG